MAKYRSGIASTRLDAQGERLTKEALESLVESISKHFAPIGIEHDPRIPPQGRVLSAEIQNAEDGEYEAIAVLEIFDNDETSETIEGSREIVISRYESEKAEISYDWTHRHEADQADIRYIANQLDSKPRYESKKSAEPISVIWLTMAFAAGGIASGFLQRIGEDIWLKLKPSLIRLMSKNETRKGEQLFVFKAVVPNADKQTEVLVVLTDPTPDDLESFRKNGISVLDSVLPFYLKNSPDIRKIVFEFKKTGLEVSFAVRKDCRPLKPTLKVIDILRRLEKNKD